MIAAKEAGSAAPVRSIEGNTFMYIRHRDMYIVAVSRANANAALIFAFLYALVDIFSGYFEADFDEVRRRMERVSVCGGWAYHCRVRMQGPRTGLH